MASGVYLPLASYAETPMDDRLDNALEFANHKVSLFQQKQNLKLRLDNLLTYAHNGGIFKITEQLISFVDAILRREVNEVVLVDSRGNPVEIKDLQSFQDEIFGLYFEATNEYLVEFDKLRKSRTVKAVTGV
jgi:hypothetical protein